MTYDGHNTFILCAVFLGDCMQSVVRLVREPEKTPFQKRNPSDLFFDSIVGNPTAAANEYVIYNRHQCVPLYLIHYSKHYRAGTQTDVGQMYTSARGGLPPFSWNSTNAGTPILSLSQANRWPFFAQTIFKLMNESDTVDPATGSPGHHNVNNPHTASQLETLRELGFTDDKSNTEKLIEFGYNLELTIDALLTAATATPDPTPNGAAAALAPVTANGNIGPGPSTSTAAPQSIGGPGPSSTVTKPSYIAQSSASVLGMIDLTASPPPPLPPSVQPLPAALGGNLALSLNKKAKLDNLSAIIDAVATGRAGGGTLNNFISAPVPVVTQKPKGRGRIPKANRTAAGSSNNPLPPAAVVNQVYPTLYTSAAPVSTAQSSNSGPFVGTAAVTTSSSYPILKLTRVPSPPAWADASGTEEDDDCPICCVTVTQWASLSCSHKLCTACHAKLLTSGKSMSVKTYTSIKCPFCNGVSGTELGTCPDGVMTSAILPNQLPGHEGYGTISVTYVVNQGKYSLNRTGYFPNSADGNRIVGLLRTAWDRRLIFSVGTSMTTGQSDVLVWNIHHKTGMSGGVQSHAYPDPTYLDRVMNELKQYGIE